MKKVMQGFITALAVTFIAAIPAFAIEGLKIKIQCPHVVLSWPSANGEFYIVQYRPTLDPITPWQTLTNELPARAGTNTTYFVHSNRVDCPSGQVFGMMMSSGGESEYMSAKFSTMSAAERVQVKQARETARLAELLIKCELEKREPYEWELKNEPPLPPSPEEVRARILGAIEKRKAGLLEGTFPKSATTSASTIGVYQPDVLTSTSLVAFGSMLAASANSCASVPTNITSSGFYRVFCPAPVALNDVFGVEQGSTMNQLDIFENDNDPDGNPILLSYVQSALHGEIEYSDDATIFRYTPTNTFSGLETFSYSITNGVGGTNTATAFVFVNEAGNNQPYTYPLVMELLTNQTTISFPILTNAVDPDSDALHLAVIEQPTRGTVKTNSSNELVYTRTSYYVAQDSFYYVLTDGRGGFVKQTVTINPQDDDGDGIPDEWELQHDLDPTVNDAYEDPDGDGLPNLAEYKLDTCPWLADNPLNLNNVVTNQLFRDYALLSMPLKSHINKPAISLLMNGYRSNTTLSKRADGCWYFTWDTGYSPNGTYPLALEFQHRSDPVPGDLPFVGRTVPVIVTNDVTFKLLNSAFSDHLVFDMKLAMQNAYWRVELFDDENQYLGYFYGSTTTGTIQGAWDLTDGQGNQLASSHVRTDVYASATSSSPPGGTNRKAKRWFIKQIPGGIGNTFVVAWGWDAYTTSFNNNRNNLMLDGVINILANPARNDEYVLRPGANGFSSGSFRFDDIDDKEILLRALKSSDSGNFFWFGHGSTENLYGNAKRGYLQPDDVGNVIQNHKHKSSERVPRDNKHPYRLVVLNGCGTYGKDWANAFGIDFTPGGTTNDVFAYYQQGRQSQAFVGWTDTIQVPRLGAANSYSTEYAFGLADFFSRWMDGYALETCLTWYAYDMVSLHNFSGHDSWKISGTAFMWRTAP